jgi:hypothetical protein
MKLERGNFTHGQPLLFLSRFVEWLIFINFYALSFAAFCEFRFPASKES